MAKLEIVALDKAYSGQKVLHGIDLAVESGAFVVFVGPSGCGKSTLLRSIAGLEEVSGGQILIDGRDVTTVDAAARGIAMVFQTYALYPHMTVEQNMSFGLEMAGIAAPERKALVARVAETLHLTPYLSRKPRALSGGQRQRVAIGRAIVRQPKIFLFDEPLSNLDAELRVKMRMEIAALHQRLGATMIYVTHDQVEAMTLADQIVVMNAGRVAQSGPPMRLYNDPDNAFVAGFIGSPRINFMPAEVVALEGAELRLAVPRLGVTGLRVTPRKGGLQLGAAVTLGLRPEHFGPQGQGLGPALQLRADAVENLGAVSYAHSLTDPENPVVIELKNQPALHKGDLLECEALDGRGFLFDAAGERL